MSSASFTPVEFLPTGAIIQSFKVGGTDIVLGFPSESAYTKTGNPPFFGETIGRVANRISNAKIASLNNGKSYPLEANEKGKTNLHGGSKGWGKQKWSGPEPVSRNGREEVGFKHVSEDEDGGFPGKVEARVFYSVEEMGDGGVRLEWEYEVELVGDEVEETVVNVTNHGFWNLTGDPTIAGTQLTLSTTTHQVVDSACIPTGQLSPFPDITPNKPIHLGEKEMSIDHCFVLNDDPSSVHIDTRPSGLKKALSLYHPQSKITLDVETTEPAFQVYTGEGINVAKDESKGVTRAFGARSGLAIEPSRYVNAINTPEWKHMVVLKKGEVWGSKSRFTAYKK